MTQQQYIDLFSSAYDQCKRMLSLFPNNAALLSIQKQLDYLLALAKREITDTSRIKEVCIGVLTARELDNLGEDVEIFYEIQNAAKFFRL
jgi:hypothetical protein